MQGYESIYIVDPNVTEEDQQGLLEKLQKAATDNGGNIIHNTLWGRRKLAYPVKKRDYGIYHVLYTDRSPDAMKAMENIYRFDESVIKWQSVAVEDVDEEFNKFEKLRSEGSAAQSLSDR